MTKDEIRQQMITKRNALSDEETASRSSMLIAKIKNDPRFHSANLIALYEPINHEVDLRELYKSNKRYALPKVFGLDMHFIEINDKTRLVRSSFGILEPVDGPIVDDELDLLLVPTLALDKNYYRIGFGKGYYDRFLAKHKPRCTLGVIYDFQLFESFSHHGADIPLDGALIA